MTQAKVLTQQEVEQVMCYLGRKPHAARNQAMFLLTHGCGVRIKELVSLRICDVLDRNGNIHQEVHLNRNQTKGDRGRTVYLSQKMREVVHSYLRERFGLENLLAVPREHLEFPLWFLKEQGWVLRSDGGQHSITAKGVDYAESTGAWQPPTSRNSGLLSAGPAR